MHISVFEAFRTSIQKVLDNFRIFVLLGLIFGGVIIALVLAFAWINYPFLPVKQLPTVLPMRTATVFELANFFRLMLGYTWRTWIILTISLIVSLFIYFGVWAGYIKALIRVYDTNYTPIQTIFRNFHFAFRLGIGLLIYLLVGLLGMLLFVIPGIFWFVRFSLFSYFLIDQDRGVFDSFSASYKATKDHFWPLFCVWFLEVLALFSVHRAPLLKVFILGPLFILTFIFFYRHLTTQPS